MSYTIDMSRGDAEILLKVGLQQEFNKHFNLDMKIQTDNSGLQVPIPYDIYKSIKDEISKFIISFQSYVQTNCKKLPFHIELVDILQLPAVRMKLFAVTAGLGAHLEIDMENELFLIYAVNENVQLNCVKSIEKTIVEGLIKIDDIRDELDQDARWCKFLESLKKETDNRDFIVKIQGSGIMMAGLYETVEKVYEHCERITDNLRNVGSDTQKLKKVADNQTSFESQSTVDSSYEVDFNVESYEVFSYLQVFQIPKLSENMSVNSYEENDKLGFVLKGPPEDIETAELLLNSKVKQIEGKTLEVEDNGYFTTPEGEHFLKEKIQEGCEVLFDTSKEGDVKDNNGSKIQRSLSPTLDESDGHQFWRWTVQQKCHIILAESNADEMSAEVVLNIKEMKSPGKLI